MSEITKKDVSDLPLFKNLDEKKSQKLIKAVLRDIEDGMVPDLLKTIKEYDEEGAEAADSIKQFVEDTWEHYIEVYDDVEALGLENEDWETDIKILLWRIFRKKLAAKKVDQKILDQVYPDKE